MSSPLISFCRSTVMPFGATYSATAVSIELAMNDEMSGMFMTFGRTLDIGTTEIEIRGKPISVTNVVLMKGGLDMSSILRIVH